MAEKKKWIPGMHLKKGALHQQLGVPMGKKIPKSKIKKAEHSKDSLLAKRAHLAETFEGMRKH